MNRTVGSLGAVVAHGLFWGWNLLFLTLLVVGLGPTITWKMLVATASGVLPWHVTAFVTIASALPIAGMLVGWRLRRDPGRMLTMFYGVQAPLMLLCLVRLFAIGALTPATALFLAVVALGCLGLLRTILVGFDERTVGLRIVRQVAQTGYLLVGLWAAAILALYVVPIAWNIADDLPREIWRELGRIRFEWDELRRLPLVATWLAFFVVSVGAMVVFPVAMVGISIRAWQVVYRAHRARDGWIAPAVAVGTVAAALVATVVASRQPQADAFAILESATTDPARRDALAASDTVRRGLLNARLADVRSFDADPTGDHVVDLWNDLVGDTAAEAPRAIWRALTRPFVYRAVHDGTSATRWWVRHRDREEAERAYAAFFDAPMGRAERDVLVRAHRQTWSWEQAQATMLEIGERKVHLDRQDLEVTSFGDHASVRIHDVYRARTWTNEEVWISFSLAEGAVPTGLWLGNTPDRAEAFRFVVAPRGAAQEVYEREVQRRVDPALLEQVGPRQYRLRAYPVPAREGDGTDVWAIGSEGPELHLWLELATPILTDDAGGYVPMPVVAEVRNLFWDGDTDRDNPVGTWVPERIPVEGRAPIARTVHVGGWEVTATPATPTSARMGHVAVLVDGTRSMGAHRDRAGVAMAELRSIADEVVVYCVVEQVVRRCDGYDPATALFWGSVALEARIAEVAPEVVGADALVVLTDAGSYELAAAAERDGLPDVAVPPLWLVHVGGLPSAYPDWTLDRMSRTGGGAVTSIDELRSAWSDRSVVGGWRWEVRPASGTSATFPTGPFADLAARQIVAHLDREARAHGLQTLDLLHEVAVGAEIVTSWSSMIVLVDDRQRQALADASAREDRFDREVASGEPPLVTAAPEPTTWLLLALGGAGVAAQRRRRADGRSRR